MAVTLKNKRPLIVPAVIQRQAGLNQVDQLVFRARRGEITITAKPPSAVGEYTPEQRRNINTRLDRASKGPSYGPFTAAQAGRFLKSEISSRNKKARKTERIE
jgi:bifunctional DNA-binding transcriptional regulator/antitoxin component of YhaV-PrlF toxin-antitoxin module